ncbi:hypothetical protein J7J47_05395 [Halomonas sp. ISL-60]|uniref:hypothetical protein n=1 Tax=Halomonas sp. ISL-56 TaxID=2819149 RepID=UPI001BEA8AAA|nr:hypothetical protein [Halomonas sp. ISL-56]MBT2771671.1 hypothetical protein [Halomonas sp. ISL-60]MBT2803162.1 hypothetical protein [Halomonas sp. ISL-56]
MSMHEFEDLVEMSINCLDQAGEHSSLDLRALFWNLYQFQEAWDTGFTHLRVIDTLLKHKFVYQFEISHHPEYSDHKAFFDSIQDFTFVSLYPEGKRDSQKNPTAGYIKPPYLFCDAGSLLWQRFVDLGVLIGNDALPPAKINIVDMVKEVMIAAAAQNDRELVSIWYTALGVHLWSTSSEEEQEDVKKNPSLEVIRAIAQEKKALEIDPGYGFFAQPTPDLIEEDPFLTGWFQISE